MARRNFTRFPYAKYLEKVVRTNFDGTSALAPKPALTVSYLIVFYSSVARIESVLIIFSLYNSALKTEQLDRTPQ